MLFYKPPDSDAFEPETMKRLAATLRTGRADTLSARDRERLIEILSEVKRWRQMLEDEDLDENMKIVLDQGETDLPPGLHRK